MWQVTGRPDAGITPKFTIRDARGDTYLIKLDPASNPELPSSVELISTKLFHAIGYHVPEDFIVTFTLDRLRVAPGAQVRNATGDKVPIEQADVERWLRQCPGEPTDRFARWPAATCPAQVVGQFMYTGRRPDDPNDLFPHERRRELRGMRVFAAWLNHDDARSINSIDTYVEDGGRRYIRHYMQDFGSNLGSGSTSAQQPRGGYEYLIERDKIGKGLVGVRLLSARVDDSEVAEGSVDRQHRSRRVRSGDLEDGVPQSRVQSAGCGRRLLGREHHVASSPTR